MAELSYIETTNSGDIFELRSLYPRRWEGNMFLFPSDVYDNDEHGYYVRPYIWFTETSGTNAWNERCHPLSNEFEYYEDEKSIIEAYIDRSTYQYRFNQIAKETRYSLPLISQKKFSSYRLFMHFGLGKDLNNDLSISGTTYYSCYIILDYNEDTREALAVAISAYTCVATSLITIQFNDFGFNTIHICDLNENFISTHYQDMIYNRKCFGLVTLITKKFNGSSSIPKYTIYTLEHSDIKNIMYNEPFEATENEIIVPAIDGQNASLRSISTIEIPQSSLPAPFNNPERKYAPIGFSLNQTMDPDTYDTTYPSLLKAIVYVQNETVKQDLNLTFNAESHEYGQSLSTSLTGTMDGPVTYEFKKHTDPDNAYTATKPTEVGEYDVRATVAETELYNSASIVATYSITKATITLTVLMSNYYANGTPSTPSVTGNTGNATVTYKYKPLSSPDSAYSSTKPTIVGTYIVKASIPETTNYKSAESTSQFIVLSNRKAEVRITATFRNYHIDELSDILNAGTVPQPTVTGNTGNAPVKLEYKLKSQRSDEYTQVFPNDVGEYDVRITAEETDEYKSAVTYATFSVYVVDTDDPDGKSSLSVSSLSKNIGVVPERNSRLYIEYGSTPKSKETLSAMSIDIDNNLKILVQGYIDSAKKVSIETSIGGNVPFVLEKCVIMDNNEIICYTASKVEYFEGLRALEKTPFSLCKITDAAKNTFVINNIPEGHRASLNVPIYEQYAIMSNGKLSSYAYRRTGYNNVDLHNGYVFDSGDWTYNALPPDQHLMSGYTVVITNDGWKVSSDDTYRFILSIPYKEIKDYFPNMKISYDSQII